MSFAFQDMYPKLSFHRKEQKKNNAGYFSNRHFFYGKHVQFNRQTAQVEPAKVRSCLFSIINKAES